MEWKNIKDELPKEDEIDVLVYGKLEVGNFYTTCMWFRGQFIDTDRTRKNITHWMSLPDPPCEAKIENDKATITKIT